MDRTELIEMVRARIGMTSTLRDVYIGRIVDAVIDELTNIKKIDLTEEYTSFMLVVDITEWRYSNPQNTGDMPIHLKKRVNDMIIKSVINRA